MQPETKKSTESLSDSKICIENLKNFYFKKSDEGGVRLNNDLNLYHEDLMSQLHLTSTTTTFLTFFYPCNGRESIVFGSNFQKGDFDGFKRYETP